MRITVTRALVELKRYDSRIKHAIEGKPFLAIGIGTSPMKVYNGTSSVEDTINELNGNITSVNDLIKNRSMIKSAIINSNSNTKVKVGDVEYTVAEAIELKTVVEFKKTFLARLRNQLITFHNNETVINNKLEETINTMINTTLGKDSKESQKEAIEMITENQKKTKEASIINRLEVEKQIETLTEEIRIIEDELDFALSESNAITEIEVDLTK